ncbi:MAG: aspartate-semialdehyde dehydrogenase [Puniceicoccaceae bacterium]
MSIHEFDDYVDLGNRSRDDFLGRGKNLLAKNRGSGFVVWMIKPSIAVVGATGAVGREILELILSRRFEYRELRLFASARSAGTSVTIGDAVLPVEETRVEAFEGIDYALFSAGGSVSKALIPEVVKRGCVVIDNSSAFRMDASVPLVVPEINPGALEGEPRLIANPNCSTAITLMGLYPLHLAFGLKRVICSTYQAVSGSGAAGVVELEAQLRAWAAGEVYEPSVYPAPIAFNLIPQVDVPMENGYTKEEMKMVGELQKIAGLPEVAVSCTCVRVPVLRAHSIAVTADFERPVDVEKAREAITAFPGVELEDDLAKGIYPMPLTRTRKAACGVGRIRKDLAFQNGLSFWVVGDQLWKGAALNAVQLLECAWALRQGKA